MINLFQRIYSALLSWRLQKKHCTNNTCREVCNEIDHAILSPIRLVILLIQIKKNTMKNNFFSLFAFLFIGIGTNNWHAQNSDGDGVANTVDLDDYNDEILDTVECRQLV